MNSKNLWQQLCGHLRDECQAYSQLRQLLTEEWSVLKKLDYQGLLTIISQKEDLLTRISRAENERAVIVRKLCPQKTPGSSLDWVVASNDPLAVPAKSLITQLVSIGRRVQQISEKNAGLMNRGQHVIREAINVVHEGLGLQPLYGQSGQLKFPTSSTSLNVEG